MKGFLLDTHVWLWYVMGDKTISPKNRAFLQKGAKENSLYLAAISLWEVAMLEKKARISLEMEALEWMQKAINLSHVELVEPDSSIAVESCRLPGDFHGDPADRMIAATARVKGFTLLTRDAQIIQYAKSNHLSLHKI